MKYSIIGIMAILLSCSKPKNENLYIKGRIMSSVDSTLPFSNTSFKFYNAGGPNALGNSWNYSQPFMTDSIGFVDATINSNEFGAGFAICWPSGTMDDAITKIKIESGEKSVDFGTIYTKP